MAKKYDIKAYACIVALAYISNKNPLQFALFWYSLSGKSESWIHLSSLECDGRSHAFVLRLERDAQQFGDGGCDL